MGASSLVAERDPGHYDPQVVANIADEQTLTESVGCLVVIMVIGRGACCVVLRKSRYVGERKNGEEQ